MKYVSSWFGCRCHIDYVLALSLHVCDIFFFKQKTAYEMRISDWSSDVCSSDLVSANSVQQPRRVASAGSASPSPVRPGQAKPPSPGTSSTSSSAHRRDRKSVV